MDIDELGIPDVLVWGVIEAYELELLNLGDLEKELAKNSGRSIETDSSTSSSESSSWVLKWANQGVEQMRKRCRC